MTGTYDTLKKVYEMFEDIKKPYPAEISMILSMLVSPERILEFKDQDIYLKYIRTLTDYRENVSFPETAQAYERYFEDCLMLKRLMEEEGPGFCEEDWLAACLRLLENLKTPYYPVYSEVLFNLKASFPDKDLFDRTLQAFYSILIRGGEENLSIIRMIAGHGRHCFHEGWLEGGLLSDLMIHQLGLFASGQKLWKGRTAGLLHLEEGRGTLDLLAAWFSMENLFLKFIKEADSESKDPDKTDSLASLLAWESEWIRKQNKKGSLLSKESGEESSLSGDQGLAGWSEGSKGNPVDSEFLNTFAYNMALKSYITNPAIGRDQEINDLELILISPKKSPILIGDSGVGKTSVVEGLAWRLQRGQVPDLLKNKTIFKLTTTSLLSGTKYVGEMEDRIRQLTTELSRFPDVILFIDEIHTIVGAGSTESSHNDISNMLKPFIDRGEIKIIGATTTQEYEAYMLPDRALARRFYPIAIEEPDQALTLEILTGTIPSMEEETRVINPFEQEQTKELLTALITLSDRKNQPVGRLTRLPELPLSILEMAFSYAALYGAKELAREHLILAIKHTNLLSKEIRMKAESFI